MYHVLTHKPKNPYCKSCRRAMMIENTTYTGLFNNTSTKCGQLVTADHVVSTNDSMLGIAGIRDILVIKDA